MWQVLLDICGINVDKNIVINVYMRNYIYLEFSAWYWISKPATLKKDDKSMLIPWISICELLKRPAVYMVVLGHQLLNFSGLIGRESIDRA